MNTSETAGGAILIACPEIMGCERVIMFLQGLWGVSQFALLVQDAPERLFADDDNADSHSALHAQIAELLRNCPAENIAVVAHGACAHNEAPHEEQLAMLRRSVDRLAALYPEAHVAGVIVGSDGHPLKIELS